MNEDDLIADLNEIESIANELSVLSSRLILKCQQTKENLVKADVSTLAAATLNTIAQEAKNKLRAKIYNNPK